MGRVRWRIQQALVELAVLESIHDGLDSFEHGGSYVIAMFPDSVSKA